MFHAFINPDAIYKNVHLYIAYIYIDAIYIYRATGCWENSSIIHGKSRSPFPFVAGRYYIVRSCLAFSPSAK